MAGFFANVEQGIHAVLQLLFGWSIAISPYFGLFLITLILTLISTLIYKYTSDQTRLKLIKEELDDLKKKVKESSGNPQKAGEYNKRMTELSMETMKHSIFNWKYMLLTLVPLGVVFNWLKLIFTPMNIWGSQWGWLWVYLIFSVFISSLARKVLKVY